jgi:hypothetical protein
MQSKIVALLNSEDNLEAAMLVRRGDGQFALARIDARLGAAARIAAAYSAPSYRSNFLDFGSPKAPRF